jgi:hypothetical protein
MESWSPRENIDAAVEAISRGVARVRRGTAVSADAKAAAAVDSAPSSAHKFPE